MFKHTFTLPSILIGAVATVAIVQTVAVSLSPTEINQAAKQFVVRIDGSLPMSNGSGSIIGKQGNLYQVLTNWHVVDSSNNPNEFTIQTVDEKTHPVTRIQQLKGADLAIITFNSSNEYQVAKLGNSENLKEGQTIHFAGYPTDKSRSYRFYPNESVNGFRPSVNADDGYEIIFTGEPLPGMSGSPLMNNEGEVIGVYGRSESNYVGGNSLLGIRINTAINLAQEQKVYLVVLGNHPSLDLAKFSRLESLLQQRNWRAANAETDLLMLDLASRIDEGWLRDEDVENFSCQALDKINTLWEKYSNDHFGYSVQSEIWREISGVVDNKTEHELGKQIGWRMGNQWIFLHEIDYSLNARRGHLPTQVWWSVNWRNENLQGGAGSTLAKKIQTCKDLNSNATITPASPSAREMQNSLISITTGVNYERLRELLQARKWKEADQLTWNLMLAAAKRKEEGWLDTNSVKSFSCEDLWIIDREWKDASNGKFGFSPQLKAYRETGNLIGDHNGETYRLFGDRVGWRKNGRWIGYSELSWNANTSDKVDIPIGHLPCGFGGGGGGAAGSVSFSSLALRLVNCNI